MWDLNQKTEVKCLPGDKLFLFEIITPDIVYVRIVVMSTEFDDLNDRVEYGIKVGERDSKLRMYRREEKYLVRIEMFANMVANGNGVAFLLPTLPDDSVWEEGTLDEGEWIYGSQLLLVANEGRDVFFQNVPLPILVDYPQDWRKHFLKINNLLNENVKVVPAHIFLNLAHFFPEEVDLAKRNLIVPTTEYFRINLKLIKSLEQQVMDIYLYKFIAICGLSVDSFLNLVSEYSSNDYNIDAFLSRMQKEGKYMQLDKYIE